jgi:hypothetical protein
MSVFIVTSLDGYLTIRDGRHAWLEEAARCDKDYGYESSIESIDALAVGRELSSPSQEGYRHDHTPAHAR